MSYLISPSEHDALLMSEDGFSSHTPEKYGADFLILLTTMRGGVQRKKFPDDFFASLADGRLARELSLMSRLEYRLLVLEGSPTYTSEGYLVDPYYSGWSQKRLRNLLRSVKIKHGVDVEWSSNLQDTILIVEEVESYLRKGVHASLMTRPKHEVKGEWGDFNKRDWARFFLQGFPGVGNRIAEAIFDTFGRVPLKWDCTEEELKSVPRIGKKTAEMLFKLLSKSL